MVNVIAELSKYFITLIMILYTLECFTVFRQKGEKAKRRVLRKQLVLIFFMDLAAFTVIFLKTEDLQIVRFYLMAMGYFLAIQILYRVFYKKASILLINNMCMLLSIGFIMLSRLDMDKAQRQFLIVAIGSAIALVVPVMIRKMRFLSKLTWVYVGVGIVLLVLVLALAQVTGGARLSIFGVQPSEFVKIIFVFCMAAMLWKDSSFPQVVRATVVAAVHVLILVLSRDLGSALIFFVTWLVMVYVSTKKPAYFALGLGGGALASVAAYFLFGHVRQRVAAWRDPFAEYQNEGYQIAQSMFAIGTGGWFGMGLCQGSPELIPVVAEDFIFGAICEELGGIFGICLVLVCMSFFLMIVNISLQIKNPFYKLIALGLGTEYAFQVFLTIGGATKFIPMTGVTLPLVSYGGSSVMSTIILLAIIQGLYILREDEGEELEKIRQTAAQTAKTTGEARE